MIAGIGIAEILDVDCQANRRQIFNLGTSRATARTQR
jgi:hypothetical protein